jgi:hypothetical protein
VNPKSQIWGNNKKIERNRAIGARSNLTPLSIWQALACKELTSTVAVVVRLTDRPLQRLLAWAVRASCQRHGSILRPWRTGGQRETRHHLPAGEGLPLVEKKNNGARGKKGEAMAQVQARGWLGLPFCNGHLDKLWVRHANMDKLWVPWWSG